MSYGRNSLQNALQALRVEGFGLRDLDVDGSKVRSARFALVSVVLVLRLVSGRACRPEVSRTRHTSSGTWKHAKDDDNNDNSDNNNDDNL